MKKPNLFIIGAPKCGTTSIVTWLRSHPNVFLCNPKEPYFFSTDIKSIRAASNVDQYFSLFQSATDNHTVIGEASTTYLRSMVAVPNILEICPNAKFVVCIRNPIDMAISAHSQLYKMGVETEKSFDKAWHLQKLRLEGKMLPLFCLEPEQFQYGSLCLLGKQIQRLLEIVPKNRVYFLLLDKIINNPEEQYVSLLKFLDIPNLVQIDFTHENSRLEPRFPALTRLVGIASRLKSKFGIKNTSIMSHANRLLLSSPNKVTISVSLKNELVDYYKSDISLLSDLLNQDFSYWIKNTL